jgi:hypothetical protein
MAGLVPAASLFIGSAARPRSSDARHTDKLLEDCVFLREQRGSPSLKARWADLQGHG